MGEGRDGVQEWTVASLAADAVMRWDGGVEGPEPLIGGYGRVGAMSPPGRRCAGEREAGCLVTDEFSEN